MIRIPTFEEAEAACLVGTATPLETFVYENEPAGTPDEVELWHEQMKALLEFITMGCQTFEWRKND